MPWEASRRKGAKIWGMHCSIRHQGQAFEKKPPLLRVQDVRKSFRGLEALKGVSFELFPGEILGLIGPNGAGKTTLINLITGFLAPDTGSIRFAGEEITGLAPEEIARRGVLRTFQHIQIFSGLSVFENVLLGLTRQTKRRFWHDLFGLKKGRSEEALFRERVEEILALFGLEKWASFPAESLPYGEQRRVVLARAVVSNPRLLLLDEPAAGLSPREGRELVFLLKNLKKDGFSVLLVDHDVELVLEVCDRVIVLAFGELIAEGPPALIREDQRVLEAYLGEEHAAG